MKSAILILLLALAPVAAQRALAEPLVPRRADPWVYLHSDGWYYFCATVPEYDRIELRRARDIEGLRSATPTTVWKKQKRFFIEDRNIWAPELHFIDGSWYIYYAAGTSVSPYDVRIMVIENSSADPLTGTWRDRGRLDTGWDSLSLDATSFELRGRRYLVWAQRLTRQDSSSMDLYIARMKDPLRLAGKAVMIGRADRAWELRDPSNLKMQGPAVLERNGRVFIAYSSNATDARYCMGLLEASDEAELLDPGSWRKLPGPVFESDPEAGIYGPGHNSFTRSADGAIDYIVYHARDYEAVTGPPILDPNRGSRVQAFSWDESGRPFFGKPR
jgi:GH43 family beta-xylosidase